MSIVEDYPGTVEVIRRYVDRGLSKDAIKRLVGPSVKEAEIAFVMASFNRERDWQYQNLKTIVADFKAKKPKPELKTKPTRAEKSAAELRIEVLEAELERLKSAKALFKGASPFISIVADVIRETGFTKGELTGPRGFKRLVMARQRLMYLLCRDTNHSLPNIGRLLGGRDHTTVIHGIRMHCLRTGDPLPRDMVLGARIAERYRTKPPNGSLLIAGIAGFPDGGAETGQIKPGS